MLSNKKYTVIEYLDFVLTWFSQNIEDFNRDKITPRERVGKNEIFGSVIQMFPDLNSKYFLYYYDMILNKLVDDGYISVKYKNDAHAKLSGNPTPIYSIEIDGILFSQSGGYSKEKIEHDRQEVFKKRSNVSNFWTPILTAAIALLALMRTFAGCDKQTIEVIHTDKQAQTTQKTQSLKTQSQNDSHTKSSQPYVKIDTTKH